jgi:hypothetical protein
MAEHAQAKHVLGLDPWMEAGSPSGHATTKKLAHVRAGLFDNLNPSLKIIQPTG